MKPRWTTLLALSLWGLVIAGLVVLLMAALLRPRDLGGLEIPTVVAFTFLVLGFATVGGVIASRHPPNPIGWIMCVSAMAFTLGGATGTYTEYSLDPGGPPARTLEMFSTRLRNQVDLDSLSRDLVAVVGATMQPVHVSLWLRSMGREREQR